jgi:hypothetical protein
MKQLKLWQIFQSKEPKQEIQEPDSNNEYIIDLASKWADHRFTSKDGRRFAYLQGSESILHRAQTLGLFLTRRERALLERRSLAGAIVEFGTVAPPMVYGDFDTLKSDWLELHESFSEPLTEEESTAFDMILTFDSGCRGEEDDESRDEEPREDSEDRDLQDF